MGLVAPFALLGLALLLPVIAMYLLKRRRDEVLVSSLYLWERVVQDMEANAPWQRLRRNLLLLLQLLFLLALVLALARPFVTRAGATGQSLIIVLDSSLSMAATDTAAGTRLDAARAEAQRLFEGLPDNGTITVIRAGNGAELLLANSRDGGALAQALARAVPTATDSDLGPALTLAAAVAEREADSEIVVLSDGAVQVPSTLTATRPVRYVPVGSSGDNQAISALELRAAAEGPQLFVQVANYGPAEVTRRLVIELDGATFSAADLQLPAGRQVSRLFTLPQASDFTVSARLAGEDLLAADDRAWAVPGPAERSRVRVVSPSTSNRYLRLPFELLGAEVAQSDVPDGPLDLEDVDLLVLDRWLPADGLPGVDTSLLIVAPRPGNDTIRATGTITNPLPLKTGNLPLVEDNLFFEDELFFVEAQVTEAPPWATVVLEDSASGAPLLWVGEQQGRRVAMLATPLYGQPRSIPLDPPRDVVLTNLVYQPGYPVLMATLADYLLVGPAGGLAGRSVPVGAPLALPLLESDTLALTWPDGSLQTLEAAPGQGTVTAVPDQAGVYELRWPGSDQEPVRFAANHFLPGESRLAPVATLALNTTGDSGTAAPLSGEARQEFWQPLLLIGLLLLTAEWLLYQRDALARLRQRVTRGST